MRTGRFEDATLDLASKFGTAVARLVQLLTGDRAELTCRDVPQGTDRSGHPVIKPGGCDTPSGKFVCVTDQVADGLIGDTERTQPVVIWLTMSSKAASA